MSNREAVVRSSAGLSDEQRQNIHGPFAASAYATQRKDRRSHRGTLIAIGGIGTVVAVSTVCIFLVWVVVPLFLPATAGQAKSVSLPSAIADCVHFEVDEYRIWLVPVRGGQAANLSPGRRQRDRRVRIICRGPTYRLVIRHRRA